MSGQRYWPFDGRKLFKRYPLEHWLELLSVPLVGLVAFVLIYRVIPSHPDAVFEYVCGTVVALLIFMLNHFEASRRAEFQRAKDFMRLSEQHRQEFARFSAQHAQEISRIETRHGQEISRLITEHKESRESLQRSHIEKLKSVLLSNVSRHDEDMSCVGGLEEAWDWLEPLIKGQEIVSVTNTVYRSPELVDHTMHHGYRTFYRWIRQLCGKGCIWQDFDWTPQNCPGVPLDIFIATMSPTQRQNYYAKALHPPFPLPQVTIIRFKGERRAVCVGYDYPGCRNPRVHVSFHPETVRYYEDWLMLLWNSPLAKQVYPISE
jgi:hypothetical protein